jgi:hypothetical protein
MEWIKLLGEVCCGTILLVIFGANIWIIHLSKKGQLVQDVPESLKDIF